MSQEHLHPSEGAHDEWLRHAFDEWDAGEPSVHIWEELEASVATDAVWERVGQSLTAEEHLQDQWIAASHAAWQPEHDTDGWAKLNDAISLEQVWRDLDHSLDQPVRTRLPIWKLAAACIAALFMVQQFSDAPVPAVQTASGPSAGKTAPTLIDSPVTATPSVNVAQATPVGQEQNTPDDNGLPNRNGLPDTYETQQQQQRIEPIAVNEPNNNSVQQSTAQDPDPNEDPQILAELEDQAIDPLSKRPWALVPGQVYATDFPDRRLPFKHWSIQLGTQLSILEEQKQAEFRSTLPHFALAADVSYRHRMGPVQFIHALGISQYSQTVGDYKGGRFDKTVQHINMLQFSSSLAYSYKRFTFYGGFLVSKGLSGLEKDDNTDVIKYVYDLEKVQTGLTGGIDYRLQTFARGNALSIGSQYQWIPSYDTGDGAFFEHMHGIRFQAKFSF